MIIEYVARDGFDRHAALASVFDCRMAPATADNSGLATLPYVCDINKRLSGVLHDKSVECKLNPSKTEDSLARQIIIICWGLVHKQAIKKLKYRLSLTQPIPFNVTRVGPHNYLICCTRL